MSPSDRMSVKEVSEYIDIGVNTLQRKAWRKKMGIPLNRIGKDLITYRPLLLKWIEERLNGKD